MYIKRTLHICTCVIKIQSNYFNSHVTGSNESTVSAFYSCKIKQWMSPSVESKFPSPIQVQYFSRTNFLVTDSTRHNWTILPEQRTAEYFTDKSRLNVDQGCNLTFDSYDYWMATSQTTGYRTFTLASLQTQGNSSWHGQQCVINGVQVGYHQDAIVIDRSFFENASHTSFNTQGVEQSVRGEGSNVNAVTPSLFYWLLYGLGALLEFTVLPGTLSFVLSLDEQTSTLAVQNSNPLLPSRYGDFHHDQSHLKESYFDNFSIDTEMVFAQNTAEKRHRSQTELMIRVILDLLHSVSGYTTDSFKHQLRKMEEAVAQQEEITTILSAYGAASLLREQIEMKRQYRLVD